MHKTLIVETKSLTGSGLGLLLACTIFLIAFLLFHVQPPISKFILPWFGGSPSVWIIAMLFSQCSLFGGYHYSHVNSTYLGLQRPTQLHIVLLLAASIMAILSDSDGFTQDKRLRGSDAQDSRPIGHVHGLALFHAVHDWSVNSIVV